MKILILSCNTGEGHNSAAKAVLEHARLAGHEVRMEDMMALAGDRVARRVGGAYVGVVKHCPKLFQFAYWLASHISSAQRKSPIYYANILMAKHLQSYLAEYPCDVIIVTHLFPAETLTYLKKQGQLRQKVIAVATDYTCIPFWEETNCDAYTSPHEDLLVEYMKRGIPPEKLKPCGIPVSSPFQHRKEREKVRPVFGLPKNVPAYLIMGGSMGFGKIHLFAERLARGCNNGEQIVIICGHNEGLERRLKYQFRKNRSVHVVGFTQQVADYMDACNVIFTKPGGLSSTEAAVKEIPIVHTAPIPGCETKNVRFFSSRGMSVSASKISEQLYYGNKLVYDEEYRQAMMKAQREGLHKDAAQRIIALAEQLAAEVER